MKLDLIYTITNGFCIEIYKTENNELYFTTNKSIVPQPTQLIYWYNRSIVVDNDLFEKSFRKLSFNEDYLHSMLQVIYDMCFDEILNNKGDT